MYGVDGRCSALNERMAGEQIAQNLRIDTSMRQSRVEAPTRAPARMGKSQVARRRGGIRTEDSVGEFEESVGSVVEVFVERVSRKVWSTS